MKSLVVFALLCMTTDFAYAQGATPPPRTDTVARKPKERNMMVDWLTNQSVGVWGGLHARSENGLGFGFGLRIWNIGIGIGSDDLGSQPKDPIEGDIPHNDYTYVRFHGGNADIEGWLFLPSPIDRLEARIGIGTRQTGDDLWVRSNATGWYYQGGKQSVDVHYQRLFGAAMSYGIIDDSKRRFEIYTEYNTIRKWGFGLGVFAHLDL